jgi:hypothetical protein
MSDCQAGCSGCSSGNAAVAPAGKEIFTGWRLGAAALWAFVLPLAMAVVGVLIARWYWYKVPGAELLAALIGLACGGAISWLAVRIIRTTYTDEPIEPVVEHDHDEI